MRASAVALVALLATGCSALGAQQSTQSSKLAEAQATHEYPSPPAPAQTAAGASGDPAQAVRVFARAYVNWTAATVAGRMRALAADSVGQARAAMQLAAAETAQDYELQRGGIANRGTVEAVAALAGRRDEYVVVTRERTTATADAGYQGLAPAWHVTIARVVELKPGAWVVSGWQPQN